MVTLPYRYPLDPTGVSPDNLVVGEQHTLPNRTIRAFAPLYGAFFTESLVLRDRTTGQVLVRNTQYRAAELYEFPTGRWGKEICGIILVTDPTVSNDVEVQYQALGGEYSTNMDAIINMFNEAMLDRPVAWPDIIGKPDEFNPAAHFHDAGDIYGFEYVVNALERLRQAILTGDAASHDEILKYVDRQDADIRADMDVIQDTMTDHMSNVNNPHNTTKAQVGLGLVENYPIATSEQAASGTGNGYMTPALTKSVVDTAISPFVTHVANTNNPHGVTKAQVGLGNVDNYATATQAEAQAGTVTNKFMTPLRTKEAIDQIAGTALTAHINNTANPHNTTQAQVGLGSVQNYGIATQAEAEAGSSNIKYMTPLRTAQAIAVQAVAPLNAHTGRTDNPHATTKAQVGLGSVENYGIATTAEAQAGATNVKYMTPLRVNERMALHQGSGDHDARYVRLNADISCSLRESGGQLHAFIAGGWRVVWPPQWQG